MRLLDITETCGRIISDVTEQNLHLSGSGLPGGFNGTVTVDCSELVSDISSRLSAGETLAELMADLHYGVMEEVEEFLNELLHLLELRMEAKMKKAIEFSNSPEPAKSLSPAEKRGIFVFSALE